MEEFELMKDAKYRLYVSAVDKALKSFDSYSDWPDLIQSLTKLNKAIKDNQRFPVIPRRIKISKMLAQCMHKTWPPGVHLKALELYDTIFKCMGTIRLSSDLFICSAGLFPLLEFSSITVKSRLLTLYETHFVPLGPRLLPGLSGFLSGVLPGLEEGTDHFDSTNNLLEKVCEGVGKSAFYGCLWHCVAGNSAIRLPAVTFVLSHFNKSLPIEEQQHIRGTSVEILVQALCAGVQDSNALVQRMVLELFLVAFPMHNLELLPKDVVRLVTAALVAVLRRDVSLNRRLYSWLLGSEVNVTKLPRGHPFLRYIEKYPEEAKTSLYFDLYSKNYLIESIKQVLIEMNNDVRPYRLLTSIIDNPNVGLVVLDDILFEVFRVLYHSSKTEDSLGSPKRKQDIIKSAIIFFNSLETCYIWHYLGSLHELACRMLENTPSSPPLVFVKNVGAGPPDIWEVSEMAEFLLRVIPCEISVDSPGEHLMNLMLRLVAVLTTFIDFLNHEQLYRSLRVCQAIMNKLQPRMVRARTENNDEEVIGEIVRPSIVRSLIGREKPDVVSSSDSENEKKPIENEIGQTLRAFLNEFQKFFVILVSGGRIINNLCVPTAFEKLTKTSASKNESYSDKLRKFLSTVMADRSIEKADLELDSSDLQLQDLDMVVAGSETWSSCFDLACGILVQASTFSSSLRLELSASLPPWMKTLLVCCCYLDHSPSLQLTAIGTLLKLLELSQRTDENDSSCTPLFEATQICYIQRNTSVIKVITEVLWGHLDCLPPYMQVTCIELLHQLLNTFTTDDCVERVLSEALLKGDNGEKLRSLLKCIKLWTIGRELVGGRKKCFQSCLLKVLDNLLLPENSPLRLETEAWLSHSLMRGDIARILDPLLLILLDSKTARLGILHVSIQPSTVELIPEEPVADKDETSKIYAISSIDGNVIYHVANDPKKSGFRKPRKWKWRKENHRDERVISIPSRKGSPDSHLRYTLETNSLMPKHISQVSLFINPFNYGEEDAQSDAGSVDEVLKNARRYNSSTQSVDDDSSVKISSAPCSRGSTPTSERQQKSCNIQDPEDSLKDECCSGNDSIGWQISREILDSLVEGVLRKSGNKSEGIGVHPLHSHLMLYCGVYDSTRALYAFKALKNILLTNSRLFLCFSATSGTVNATYPSDLLVLLARHRKSVYGRSFDGSLSSVNEYIAAFRSSMYLEVLISLCLNFARSYYPNIGERLTPEIIKENRLVQLTSIETLTEILNQLIPLVRDSGKGFANYIATILSKCKVQKIILRCLMSSLNTIRDQLQLYDPSIGGGRTFTEEIIEFNDPSDGPRLTEHARTSQVQLLKLVLALIKLEYDVESHKAESTDLNSQEVETAAGSTLAASYTPGYLIPQQPLFFRAVASALSLKGSMRSLHSEWTHLVTSSLPYLGSALPQIVMTFINQLCINVEDLAEVYKNLKCEEDLPPDYAVTQIEALTVLCHYCVLESSQQVSPLGVSPPGATGNSASNPSQIFSNLVHVFTPLPLVQETSRDQNEQMEILRGVRSGVLRRMPRLISSLSAVWLAVAVNPLELEFVLWGSPKVVRNQILEFLSPLAVHHGPYFLAAMAVVWHERRDKNCKQVLPVPTPQQQVLVHLLSSMRVLPIDTFVQTIHMILKQPPAVEATLQDMVLEVSVLELLYVYMQTTSSAQLVECWGSLLSLLRDSLLLPPPALFLFLAILNEYVQRSPSFYEKKDQKDLQEVTAKLIEGCATIAGACLEQTTWLKRNLSVRDLDSIEDDTNGSQAQSLLQTSVQAQLVLAQILAPLLDVSYGSQEKEKVAALLISVMANVTPYLRNHQARYAASFSACSQLLASISGFPYTRKAWKKDAFDLLLDPALFQMEPECLFHWTIVVDNLMTHDQTTFNDLMASIPAASSASYSIFSSRDQENEQRAQMLKRLAFVIMCSGKDQYCKSIIPIQDRLSESLRSPNVLPSIQAQVFFCFRVLLLRMSSEHVDALWSLIISEIVPVFMHIEQELARESDEFKGHFCSHIRNMSGLDPSWVMNGSNGLNAHGHPHWLLLTLAAAKLLDLAVLLPANYLPQFQMYRWAFVGDYLSGTKQEHEFIPHVKRVCKLMDEKYGPCEMFVRAKEGQLLLTESNIDSLQQLHPFFHALQSRPKSDIVDMEAVEKSILYDFLDKLP